MIALQKNKSVISYRKCQSIKLQKNNTRVGHLSYVTFKLTPYMRELTCHCQPEGQLVCAVMLTFILEPVIWTPGNNLGTSNNQSDLETIWYPVTLHHTRIYYWNINLSIVNYITIMSSFYTSTDLATVVALEKYWFSLEIQAIMEQTNTTIATHLQHKSTAPTLQ